jgi:peroxiredoxin
LRGAHDKIAATGATVVAIAPHSLDDTRKHLKTNTYPFTVLADPDGTTFDTYDVTSRLISLGQQPALFVIGTDGLVSFDAVGNQQWDLVGPDKLVQLLTPA